MYDTDSKAGIWGESKIGPSTLHFEGIAREEWQRYPQCSPESQRIQKNQEIEQYLNE
jgi:hypothetical protein